MNLERFTNDMKSAKAVQSILDLAGLDYENGLAQLQAVSEAQRSYGADVRIRALALLWQQVSNEYQSAKFAGAVLRAANKHAQARWWIDRQSHTLGNNFDDLDGDIEQELEHV